MLFKAHLMDMQVFHLFSQFSFRFYDPVSERLKPGLEFSAKELHRVLLHLLDSVWTCLVHFSVRKHCTFAKALFVPCIPWHFSGRGECTHLWNCVNEWIYKCNNVFLKKEQTAFLMHGGRDKTDIWTSVWFIGVYTPIYSVMKLCWIALQLENLLWDPFHYNFLYPSFPGKSYMHVTCFLSLTVQSYGHLCRRKPFWVQWDVLIQVHMHTRCRRILESSSYCCTPTPISPKQLGQ